MRFSLKRFAKVIVFVLAFVLLVTYLISEENVQTYTFLSPSPDYHGSMFGVYDVPSQSYKHTIIKRSDDVNDEHKVNRSTNRNESLANIYISVKTTGRFHKSRVHIILETWVKNVQNQTYIFTDTADPELEARMPEGHVINTNCLSDHQRKSLVCKMAQEFDMFIISKKHWFCHVDDDTYVNVDRLVALLIRYNHTDDWYLGRPSLSHPIEVQDRTRPGQNIAFWFATGGAGFCISRSLALKMIPYAGGGRLMRAGDQIRLPDDCTIGYIIDSLLRKQLTVIPEFHSHLEALWHISNLKNQITFSYSISEDRVNIVNVPGFKLEKDPTSHREDDSLERLVITGSLDDQKGRERPPMRWSDQIKYAMGMPMTTALQTALC